MVEVTELPDQLGRLETWLDQGWRIEQPIFQRSVLHGRDGRSSMFEVILRRGGEWRVIALGDDPSVHGWLHASGIDVLQI